MASTKKTYFLVPGWDIPPSAIQLGNLIADPTEPHKALNCTPTSHLVHTHANPSTSKSVLNSTPTTSSTVSSTAKSTRLESRTRIDTKIHTTTLTNYIVSLSSSKSNKLGIFAQFLQIFGLGGESSVEYTSENAGRCTFSSLTTEWFSPSQSFLATSYSTSLTNKDISITPQWWSNCTVAQPDGDEILED
ncbi:hypothetical protein VTL71DRAFT_14164 [Oculimacula yallundae]|uniref:Uncharacterized protein n=1 Tax=Oculimacula yallundae TaxID=86028 RepID=A0ABR4CHP9_9HELO